jgi:hypothetical protein
MNELQQAFDSFVEQWVFRIDEMESCQHLLDIAVEIFDDLYPQMHVCKQIDARPN